MAHGDVALDAERTHGQDHDVEGREDQRVAGRNSRSCHVVSKQFSHERLALRPKVIRTRYKVTKNLPQSASKLVLDGFHHGCVKFGDVSRGPKDQHHQVRDGQIEQVAVHSGVHGFVADYHCTGHYVTNHADDSHARPKYCFVHFWYIEWAESIVPPLQS